MAVSYTGPRPVTKGRSSTDSVHTWKGVAGTYSNWDLFNTSHVLDGAPNNDHTPGTGRHPHGLKMSRLFTGLEDGEQPTVDPGHTDNLRYRPLENKAAGNSLAFKSGYGHADRVTGYSLVDHYDDTYRQTHLGDPGHTERVEGDAGVPATYGKFNIYIYKGITAPPIDDGGQSLPTDNQNAYGKNKINEWTGVPASKALNV